MDPHDDDDLTEVPRDSCDSPPVAKKRSRLLTALFERLSPGTKRSPWGVPGREEGADLSLPKRTPSPSPLMCLKEASGVLRWESEDDEGDFCIPRKLALTLDMSALFAKGDDGDDATFSMPPISERDTSKMTLIPLFSVIHEGVASLECP